MHPRWIRIGRGIAAGNLSGTRRLGPDASRIRAACRLRRRITRLCNRARHIVGCTGGCQACRHHRRQCTGYLSSATRTAAFPAASSAEPRPWATGDPWSQARRTSKQAANRRATGRCARCAARNGSVVAFVDALPLREKAGSALRHSAVRAKVICRRYEAAGLGVSSRRTDDGVGPTWINGN